jgi:hypothetical protein
MLVAGISSVSAAPAEIVQGNLKLVLYPETGTFSLFQLSEIGKNRFEPLFDDRNSATTTSFYVLSNSRIFKLAKKIGKPVVFQQSGQEASFTFTLTDDFQVVQKFSFVPASGGNPVALRIDTCLENTSGKAGSFALKAVIDTRLGESSGIHFRTDVRSRISAETLFDFSLDPDRYIVSASKNQSLLIPLVGKDVTSPSLVYAANWDRLNTLSWKPDYVAGRSFNTIYSVNDSALLFVWPEKKLEANEQLSITMLLGPETPELISIAHDGKTAAPKIDSAKADPSKLTAKQRNELVEQILARIAEINANPGSATDDELDRLNATLDVMLKAGRE